jgi:hypothetical protein
MNVDSLAGLLFLGSQILDGVTTYYILNHSGVEANPILVTFGLAHKPTALLALKLSLGMAGLVVATLKGNAGYVPGEVCMISVAAVSLYMGAHNLFEIISAQR